MDYATITPAQEADFYRRRLLQAEDDHMRHTADKADRETQLASLPKDDENRAAVEAQIASLDTLVAAAEERAVGAKAALEGMGEPLVEPAPEPVAVEPAPSPAVEAPAQ